VIARARKRVHLHRYRIVSN